jgi:adenylate kinase
MPVEHKTMMPCALKPFMQYLDEKGIVSGTERVRRIVESEQDDFQKNAKKYLSEATRSAIVVAKLDIHFITMAKIFYKGLSENLTIRYRLCLLKRWFSDRP